MKVCGKRAFDWQATIGVIGMVLITTKIYFLALSQAPPELLIEMANCALDTRAPESGFAEHSYRSRTRRRAGSG